MKRISSLIAILTVLCLLCSLPGTGFAQTAETPPDTAETGGWPPELIGSWVGFHENLWVQYSFFWNGYYRLTVFEDPSLDSAGTWETFGKDYSVKALGSMLGGQMRLTLRGTTGTFRRMPDANPYAYVRMKPEDETIDPSMDPLLLGTWGGRIGEDYVEWTFHGNGSLTRVTPYLALTEEGHYFIEGGSLNIPVYGQLNTCAYKASADSITMDLPDGGRVILNKKAGQLKLMLQVEDYGLLWPHEGNLPKGPRIGRYLGNETEVGIPDSYAYCPVVRISENAFAGNKRMESITITPFIVSIGTEAFEGCESLRDVLFIYGETAITGADWQGFTIPMKDFISYGYNSVTITPGSCPLITIGEGAFRGCKNLENLNLAQSALESPIPRTPPWLIGHSDVKGINFPEGLETIGANAFEGCESVTSADILDSVTFIGSDAFKGCPNLTLTVSPDSYPLQYAISNGIPYNLRSE